MSAARRLCQEFGITLKTNERCGEMETHCINVIPHLAEKHGSDAMVLTMRVLTETHPNNRFQLNREVITAVNAVCRLKRWTSLGLAFLDPWDAMDLGELHQRAVSFGLRTQPVWATLAALIIDRLRPVLEPPKPPARTKAKVMADNLALGIALLRLKLDEPERFGALAHELHRVDPKSAIVYRTMAAARLYADRPEITGKVSWEAVRELSAPSLPADLRRKFEAAIVSGQIVEAAHIRRARQAHTKRPAHQPARMAA